MGRGSSKQSGSKDERWTSSLHYTPDAENPGKYQIQIADDDVIEYFNNVKGARNEILQAWIYKQNLTGDVPNATELWHGFVVVESTDWYWSLEKDAECVRVQRSRVMECVVDYYRGERRAGSVAFEKGPCKGLNGDMIQHIFEWLYADDHLNERFHFLDSNGQYFASEIYDAIRNHSVPFGS